MWVIFTFLLGALAVITIKLALNLAQMKREMEKLNIILETVENVKEIIYYCDVPDLHYRYVSPAVETIFGPNALQEHLDNPNKIFEIVHPDDYEILMKKKLGTLDYSQPIVVRLKNHLGEYIWFEEYAIPVYEDGKLVAMQGIYRNINEKVKLQQQLEQRATHDGLTNLYNRAYFDAKFNQYNETTDTPITIAICDLDNLKCVNDQYGHKTGDDLIKEVARIFNKVVKNGEFVARIGGDEFAFMLVAADEARVCELFTHIQLEVDAANRTNKAFQIEMSKGYASHSSSLHEMERLYMEADNRMYAEKKTRVRYRASGEIAVGS
ncbi:MAG: sensor domain-containing diguanylate cyclase [Solibacillus sp.]